MSWGDANTSSWHLGPRTKRNQLCKYPCPWYSLFQRTSWLCSWQNPSFPSTCCSAMQMRQTRRTSQLDLLLVWIHQLMTLKWTPNLVWNQHLVEFRTMTCSNLNSIPLYLNLWFFCRIGQMLHPWLPSSSIYWYHLQPLDLSCHYMKILGVPNRPLPIPTRFQACHTADIPWNCFPISQPYESYMNWKTIRTSNTTMVWLGTLWTSVPCL